VGLPPAPPLWLEGGIRGVALDALGLPRAGRSTWPWCHQASCYLPMMMSKDAMLNTLAREFEVRWSNAHEFSLAYYFKHFDALGYMPTAKASIGSNNA